MAVSLHELEALQDLEYEGEWESEPELEGEGEEEAFFGSVLRLGSGLFRSPALRRVAARAGRAALRGGRPAVTSRRRPVDCTRLSFRNCAGQPCGYGGSGACRWGGIDRGCRCLGAMGPGTGLPGSRRERDEALSPIRRVYPDALMEHLGHAAAEAESEAEAEAFVGALVPLAARLAPRIAPAVMRAAPQLIRGAAGVALTLRASPATRPLVRALPAVLRRTVRTLAGRAAAGRPITPAVAVRALAGQTGRTLARPALVRQALRRARALDARFHRATAGTGACRCGSPG